MAYEDFKDLTRRIASDKILCGKSFNITKNCKYGGYKRGLASMSYKFFHKKLQVVPLCCKINLQLKMKIFQIKNEKLHKPIRIKKFPKRKLGVLIFLI